MSQTNTTEPAGTEPGGNLLIKYHGDTKPSGLTPGDFVAVEWRLIVRAARLMHQPFELYVDGRWRSGVAGDYVVFGARGEVAIVSGRDFPQLCHVQGHSQ